MRKSNFFNFTIQLYDGSQQPVEVHKAAFKDFYDTHSVSHLVICHLCSGRFDMNSIAKWPQSMLIFNLLPRAGKNTEMV